VNEKGRGKGSPRRNPLEGRTASAPTAVPPVPRSRRRRWKVEVGAGALAVETTRRRRRRRRRRWRCLQWSPHW